MNVMLHELSDEHIADIAADCHGYVGADLQNLCRLVGFSLSSLLSKNAHTSCIFI